MKQYCKYAFLVGWGLATLAAAPAQRVYTLDECISEALRNNVRIKNADNDLAAARHERQKAATNYFPSVSASGGGFMASNSLLHMELAPGMAMSLMKNGVVGGVTAAVPLFTGGQVVNGNKLAKTGVEVSRLQRRQSENEVRLTTEQYYWQIVVLKEKLKTLDTVQEQLERMRSDAQAAVEAGIANRNDLLQVQLRKNEMHSSRISVANTLAVARSLLAQYIGHPADSLDVDLQMDGGLPPKPDSLYRSPQASLPLTNEYRLLQKNVEAGRLQYRMALGKNLPTIALGGGYMYENLMDRNHNFWMGFATVSVPLTGWWGGTHDLKKQKLQLANAENQLADQSQLLAIRMQNTWNAMTDAYKQVEIAIESIGQATENLRLQTDYYQAGTCTISDLLEAQTLYRQSRDGYVEAYAQFCVKKREYLQATGR